MQHRMKMVRFPNGEIQLRNCTAALENKYKHFRLISIGVQAEYEDNLYLFFFGYYEL